MSINTNKLIKRYLKQKGIEFQQSLHQAREEQRGNENWLRNKTQVKHLDPPTIVFLEKTQGKKKQIS